jgi:hypothetical protein
VVLDHIDQVIGIVELIGGRQVDRRNYGLTFHFQFSFQRGNAQASMLFEGGKLNELPR